MKRLINCIFVVSFIFVNTLCFASLIFANNNSEQLALRNPFLTLYEQKFGVTNQKKDAVKQVLNLEGVFIWPDRKMALINGQVVKEGDSIEGKEVASIQKEEVILKDKNGGTLVLGLPLVLNETIESEK